MPTFTERLQHAWNAFRANNRDPTNYGSSYSYNYSRTHLYRGNERSIINSIKTRIANDAAQIGLVHARVNENGNFLEKIPSGLQNIFSVEANIDQSARDFLADAVWSMLDEGTVACVPIDTNIDPATNSSFNILTMRTGRILEWAPKTVKVEVYNEKTGRKETVTVLKKSTVIVTNPFYEIMNSPNSTLQRLIRKLNLLDAIDEQSGSGKLDMLISVPYSLSHPGKEEWAKKRRKEIEDQLTNSKYGFAYIDQTEHVTQLNRPLENNLMKQVEFLTTELYSQMGITADIFSGAANEQTMLNYFNNVIDPILTVFAQEFDRVCITKTARTQGQKIIFIKDRFKFITLKDLAQVLSNLNAGAIISSNEGRSRLGYKPSEDPKADELWNKNINQYNEQQSQEGEDSEMLTEDEEIQNET